MTPLPECQKCGKPIVVGRLEALAMVDTDKREMRDRFCVQCFRQLLHQAYLHAFGLRYD